MDNQIHPQIKLKNYNKVLYNIFIMRTNGFEGDIETGNLTEISSELDYLLDFYFDLEGFVIVLETLYEHHLESFMGKEFKIILDFLRKLEIREIYEDVNDVKEATMYCKKDLIKIGLGNLVNDLEKHFEKYPEGSVYPESIIERLHKLNFPIKLPMAYIDESYTIQLNEAFKKLNTEDKIKLLLYLDITYDMKRGYDDVDWTWMAQAQKIQIINGKINIQRFERNAEEAIKIMIKAIGSIWPDHAKILEAECNKLDV